VCAILQYAFEVDHRDRGETAKMKTFIDHVKNELSLLEAQLPSVTVPAFPCPDFQVVSDGIFEQKATNSQDKAKVSSLVHVLEAGMLIYLLCIVCTHNIRHRT
jgi:hypothetical protein